MSWFKRDKAYTDFCPLIKRLMEPWERIHMGEYDGGSAIKAPIPLCIEYGFNEWKWYVDYQDYENVKAIIDMYTYLRNEAEKNKVHGQ